MRADGSSASSSRRRDPATTRRRDPTTRGRPSARRRRAPLPGLAWLAAGALCALAATAPAGALAAQQPGFAGAGSGGTQVVDRVVAVVGDTTIALSEVQEEVFRMRQRGMQLPRDPFARDSVLREVLNRLVEETMLLEQAKRMGVTVPQEQVEQLANDRFSRYRSQFPSDQAMRQAVESTGQNMFQFREMLRSQAWAQLTMNRLRQTLVQQNDLPPATVDEREIRRFFEQNAAGRQRPGSVSLSRVMVAPRPDSAAADSARARAQQALDAVRSETDFAVAARRYSDDTGTREDGGDLGWIRRSDVVPGFGDAAWSAPPGRAVGPVESRLGYHVIRVENVRGGERRVRHILIRARVTETDVEEARRRAATLADSLRRGADADRLSRQHGLSGEQVRFDEVRLDELRSRLGDAYAEAIGSPSAGDVIGPIRVEGSYGIPLFAVMKIRAFTPTGEYRLEDVRDQIRQRLLRQKQFEKYVDQLRNEMHVAILI